MGIIFVFDLVFGVKVDLYGGCSTVFLYEIKVMGFEFIDFNKGNYCIGCFCSVLPSLFALHVHPDLGANFAVNLQVVMLSLVGSRLQSDLVKLLLN